MIHKFVLQKVEFENNSWRKLSGLSIPIAPRLTVIAGHNGIGKSSILGFIGNASGFDVRLEDGRTIKTYSGSSFQTEFSEQFRLTEQDVTSRKRGTGRILLSYKVDNIETPFVKTCKVGLNKDGRYRVVPRNKSNATEHDIGASQKVQLPTIFVSTSRLIPIGEDPEAEVKDLAKMHPEDRKLISDFLNHVLCADEASHDAIQDLRVTFGGKGKHTLLPKFYHKGKNYDGTAISLGQGAITAIATALASFNRLFRVLKHNYKGGILVIDEIEDGLHPRALLNLMQRLCGLARKLHLQVIVTTHSLVVLDLIRSKIVNESQAVDKIIYLKDTTNPVVEINPDVDEMWSEMTLSATSYRKSMQPPIYVYLEDDEALYVLRCILKFKKSSFSEKEIVKARIHKVPLKLGAHQLMELVSNPKADHFYKHSVCVLDGDQDIAAIKNDRCITLPAPFGQSPEKEIYSFLKANKEKGSTVIKKLSSDFIKNYISKLDDSLLEDVKKEREHYKKWFKEIRPAHRDSILEAWVSYYDNEVSNFLEKYKAALRCARKAVRSNY